MHSHLIDNAFAFDNADGAFALDNVLLDNAVSAFACELDHAFMPYFDHALKVAPAFATKFKNAFEFDNYFCQHWNSILHTRPSRDYGNANLGSAVIHGSDTLSLFSPLIVSTKWYYGI